MWKDIICYDGNEPTFIGLKFDDATGVLSIENEDGLYDMEGIMCLKDGIMAIISYTHEVLKCVIYENNGDGKKYLKYSDIKKLTIYKLDKGDAEWEDFSLEDDGKVLLKDRFVVSFACYDYMQGKKEIYLLGEDDRNWDWIYRNTLSRFCNHSIITNKNQKLLIGNYSPFNDYDYNTSAVLDEFYKVIENIGYKTIYYTGENVYNNGIDTKWVKQIIIKSQKMGIHVVENIIGNADKNGRLVKRMEE